MFGEMVEMFNRVIELAKEKRNIETISRDFSLETIRDSDYFNARRKLVDYLEELDYDRIKIIQTVMYVGRDPSHELMDYNPQDLYGEVFNSLTWHQDKSVEINQIAEKAPLDDYLKRGMKLLKIK